MNNNIFGQVSQPLEASFPSSVKRVNYLFFKVLVKNEIAHLKYPRQCLEYHSSYNCIGNDNSSKDILKVLTVKMMGKK